MNKDILLYFALLLWFVVPVTAQPTIFTPTTTVDEDAAVEIDVRVLDFESIMSMQFSVNWDTAVLKFDSITNLGALPDYTIANFNTNSSNEGKFTTLWLGDPIYGNTLDDSTSIFSIAFTVIGSPDSQSSVAITNDPLAIEVTDLDGNELPVIIENGMITVVGPLSTKPANAILSNELFVLYQNKPNPFDNQTVIMFDLRESSEVEFLFYDINGKLIYSAKNYFLEGKNEFSMSADKLPRSGTYFYTLKTNDFSLTNKMVLLR